MAYKDFNEFCDAACKRVELARKLDLTTRIQGYIRNQRGRLQASRGQDALDPAGLDERGDLIWE
jgi:hypothetical protein